MTQKVVITSRKGKWFTAEQVRSVMSRPGIKDYTITTQGFVNIRIKQIELLLESPEEIFESEKEVESDGSGI